MQQIKQNIFSIDSTFKKKSKIKLICTKLISIFFCKFLVTLSVLIPIFGIFTIPFFQLGPILVKSTPSSFCVNQFRGNIGTFTIGNYRFITFMILVVGQPCDTKTVRIIGNFVTVPAFAFRRRSIFLIS
jgi:hypothetical protein